MFTHRLTAVVICLIISLSIFAQRAPFLPGEEPPDDMNEDKTLSPYFMILGDDEKQSLPLLSTSADVDIAGVIADVVVTQVYKNDGESPIEAIYVFPASTRAAVYGMQMTIGDRTIVAKIEEKQKARQDYEQAKADGKSASLLEQKRPNVFQMNVANIMPGDTIIVELKYTELLVPTDGVYEFVYPTVVGPRFSTTIDNEQNKDEKWIANPFLPEGEGPTYTFDINVNISTGIPIQEMTCHTHDVDINYESANFGNVKLNPKEKFGGNKDFILKYKLQGGKIESGILLYEGEDENFFLTMIQPPDRFKTNEIPPREYIFIVDVSGSMHGYPLDISKKLMRNLLGNLRESDYFNITLFASGSSLYSPTSVQATKDNIDKAIKLVDSSSGSGGTMLLDGLKRAFGVPQAEEGVSRAFVVITDGYVTVEKESFEMVRQNLNKANLFAFGIGSSVNRYIIEGLAHAGMGEPFVVTEQSKAPAKADKFREYIQNPLLTQIEMSYPGFDTYDIEPLSVPDVMAKRPVIVFGKYRGKPNGSIELKGKTGKNKTYSQEFDISKYEPSETNSAIRYLWARHKLQILSDYEKMISEMQKEKIIEIGLKYNLLTDYTSFIAIDSEVRNKTGSSSTVTQPLPLPEGVSNYAVGGSSSYKRTRDLVATKQYACTESMVDGIAAAPLEVVPTREKIDKNVVSLNIISSNHPIDEAAFKKLIGDNSSAIYNCVSGSSVTIEITFNPDGTVKKVDIKTSLPSKAEQCLKKALKSLYLNHGNSSKLVIEFKVNS